MLGWGSNGLFLHKIKALILGLQTDLQRFLFLLSLDLFLPPRVPGEIGYVGVSIMALLKNHQHDEVSHVVSESSHLSKCLVPAILQLSCPLEDVPVHRMSNKFNCAQAESITRRWWGKYIAWRGNCITPERGTGVALDKGMYIGAYY